MSDRDLGPDVEVFRLVVDGMDEGIVLTDSDQKVTFANAFAERLFGGPLTGRSVADLKPMVTSASEPDAGELLRGEVLVTNAARGRQTRCYLNVAPLCRGDKSSTGLVWTFFELSAELANTRAFLDFAAELAEVNRELLIRKEEILHLSRTDRLTGTADRRTILEVLDKAVDFAQAHESDLSAARFDVDHFQEVIEAKGERFADEVLKQVASAAQDRLGAFGTLGRLDGDRFLVVLPGADREQARTFGEEIRVAIHRETVALGVPATATVGVAFRPPGTESDQLLSDTAAAVRQGKAAGGNQVVVHLSLARTLQ
jgi:diguanylate cyclase (GGDEF)-like protein